MDYLKPDIIKKNLATSMVQVSLGYNAVDALLDAYSLNQERSLVKAQNKVALSQYLPTNNTLLLKDEKIKKAKVQYVMPTTWKDTFKLIKLIWQTRQQLA